MAVRSLNHNGFNRRFADVDREQLTSVIIRARKQLSASNIESDEVLNGMLDMVRKFSPAGEGTKISDEDNALKEVFPFQKNNNLLTQFTLELMKNNLNLIQLNDFIDCVSFMRDGKNNPIDELMKRVQLHLNLVFETSWVLTNIAASGSADEVYEVVASGAYSMALIMSCTAYQDILDDMIFLSKDTATINYINLQQFECRRDFYVRLSYYCRSMAKEMEVEMKLDIENDEECLFNKRKSKLLKKIEKTEDGQLIRFEIVMEKEENMIIDIMKKILSILNKIIKTLKWKGNNLRKYCCEYLKNFDHIYVRCANSYRTLQCNFFLLLSTKYFHRFIVIDKKEEKVINHIYIYLCEMSDGNDSRLLGYESRIREQAIWLMGNVLGEGGRTRRNAIESGTLDYLEVLVRPLYIRYNKKSDAELRLFDKYDSVNKKNIIKKDDYRENLKEIEMINCHNIKELGFYCQKKKNEELYERKDESDYEGMKCYAPSMSEKELKQIAWTFCNMVRTANDEHIWTKSKTKRMLTLVYKLLLIDERCENIPNEMISKWNSEYSNSEFLKDMGWCLSYFVDCLSKHSILNWICLKDDSIPMKDKILFRRFLLKLFSILNDTTVDFSVAIGILRAIGNMIYEGSPDVSLAIMELGVIDVFLKLMDRSSPRICRDVMWSISNMAAVNNEHVRYLLDFDKKNDQTLFFPTIQAYAGNKESSIRDSKEGIWIYMNLIEGAEKNELYDFILLSKNHENVDNIVDIYLSYLEELITYDETVIDLAVSKAFRENNYSLTLYQVRKVMQDNRLTFKDIDLVKKVFRSLSTVLSPLNEIESFSQLSLYDHNLKDKLEDIWNGNQLPNSDFYFDGVLAKDYIGNYLFPAEQEVKKTDETISSTPLERKKNEVIEYLLPKMFNFTKIYQYPIIAALIDECDFDQTTLLPVIFLDVLRLSYLKEFAIATEENYLLEISPLLYSRTPCSSRHSSISSSDESM
ncbi:hypothetical protein SNEBB_009151 [Seison nebaliae]|nr:hypothetical protein SNEBB_009151 [Seison nebaliae]